MEDRIMLLMKEGWNINIECKSKGREYELSYEATATRTPQPGDTQKQITLSFYPVHCVADSIKELIDILEQKIKQKTERGLLNG